MTGGGGGGGGGGGEWKASWSRWGVSRGDLEVWALRVNFPTLKKFPKIINFLVAADMQYVTPQIYPMLKSETLFSIGNLSIKYW